MSDYWIIADLYMIDLRKVSIMEKLDGHKYGYIVFYFNQVNNNTGYKLEFNSIKSRDETYEKYKKMLITIAEKENNKSKELSDFKEEIRNMLLFSPGGPGFHIAQSDFEENKGKNQ